MKRGISPGGKAITHCPDEIRFNGVQTGKVFTQTVKLTNNMAVYIDLVIIQYIIKVHIS